MIWMDALRHSNGIFQSVQPSLMTYPEAAASNLNVPDNYRAQRYQGGMVRPISDRVPSIAPVGQYKWKQTYACN